MKKVLYVTNTSRMVNAFFIPHMNMLLEQGYDVSCACNVIEGHPIKKDKFIKEVDFFDVSFMRNPWSIKNLKGFMKLYKMQKKNEYDIIHVHSPVAAMFTRMLKPIFPNVKMIYTAHGFHFYKGSSKLSWMLFGNIEKFFARFTDVLITINKEDFEVAKTFKCKDVRWINGVGVNSEEFSELEEGERAQKRKELGIKEEDRVFIVVGEHNKNKNQEMLLGLVDEINTFVNNAEFVFIGDGVDFEKNKHFVEEHHLDNCHILGFRKDVNELINASDVVLSLSHREGLPKNLLEALAVGKAILSTNIRGNNELVENGENGYLFDINDNKGLEELIVKLSTCGEEFYNHASEISKKIFDKYELNNVNEELIKVY
ncbi:MAG: glycosyltransferase [Sarcina sp.]